METTKGTVLALLWSVAKYPEVVRIFENENDTKIIRVYCHKDDLSHLNKNKAPIETVLDQKLGRRIKVEFITKPG